MNNQTLTQLANKIIALRSAPSPIPAPLTYKSGGHTSAMIALFVPISTGIHFIQSDPGALPLNELHCTLAYLGKADHLSLGQIKAAHGLMRLISENHPPLTGHINGCGRFCNGDDDGDPFFIIPDLAALPNLRQVIIDGLGSHSIEGAKDQGFVPHITLTYLPHAESNPFDIIEKTPISFGNISLVLGDDRYDYPLARVGAPLGKAALIEKIGARHTGAEHGTIQKMHDLTLELGAECHPLTRRAGARHSHADQGLVQRIHDDCAGLGAECKALPERDRVYSSQVLKEGEIIKGGATSGNWGHIGRPGKLGGSTTGGGHVRIGVKRKDLKTPGKIKQIAKQHRQSVENSKRAKKMFQKVKHGGKLNLIADDGLKVDVSIKTFGGAFGMAVKNPGTKKFGKHFIKSTNDIENYIGQFQERKAALTIRAQSDAPNYQAASTPQRCANCRFFLGDPGRDRCDLFDFTADPDYGCDDWEAQKPNEIPGYVANKSDLAALTEGILILRGRQPEPPKLT